LPKKETVKLQCMLPAGFVWPELGIAICLCPPQLIPQSYTTSIFMQFGP